MMTPTLDAIGSFADKYEIAFFFPTGMNFFAKCVIVWQYIDNPMFYILYLIEKYVEY